MCNLQSQNTFIIHSQNVFQVCFVSLKFVLSEICPCFYQAMDEFNMLQVNPEAIAHCQ